MFGRYVDDIIRTARAQKVEDILKQAKTLHPALEKDGSIPFLDILVTRTSAGIIAY